MYDTGGCTALFAPGGVNSAGVCSNNTSMTGAYDARKQDHRRGLREGLLNMVRVNWSLGLFAEKYDKREGCDVWHFIS